MQTHWHGVHLDGRTARRSAVTVHPSQDGLVITPETGETRRWAYAEIRQIQGRYAGEQIRIERRDDVTEALLIDDASFLSALHRLVPDRVTHFHNPARRPTLARLTVAAGLLSVGLIGWLYVWGVPALITVTTPYVPVAWEEKIGAAAVDYLIPAEERCTAPEHAAVIRRIVARLAASVSPQPYTFRVHIADSPDVNALAAPGGHIVLFRGLLQRMRTPEELAGVLAHEMQHVLLRHGTRALLQSFSTGLLLAFITSGDPSGVAALGLEGAHILNLLRHSRHQEAEADRAGMDMLRAAQIDPKGMIAFFESIRQHEHEQPGLLHYFSTHPDTAGRLSALRDRAMRASAQPVAVVPDYDWRRMRTVCTSGE